MRLVVVFIQELDNSQDEVIGLVERIEDLVAGDGDALCTRDSPFHLDETQLAGPGDTAFNVVAELLEFAVGGIKTQTALDAHNNRTGTGRAGLGIDRGGGNWSGASLDRMEQADRHHQGATQDYRWQRRELGLKLKFFQSALQASLQQISALACLAGIEFRVGLAGLLLKLEVFGTVIPVGDFPGESLLYASRGFVDSSCH